MLGGDVIDGSTHQVRMCDAHEPPLKDLNHLVEVPIYYSDLISLRRSEAITLFADAYTRAG